MSGAENVHLIGWVLVFLMILLSQTLLLLGAYFKLDQIEGHFNASHLVSINRNTAGDGPFGRMNRLRLIGALTGSFYQHQMLDPYAFMEAEILPARLRKWAETPKKMMRIAVVSAGLLLLWSGFVSLRTTISNPMSDLKLLYTAILIGFSPWFLSFRCCVCTSVFLNSKNSNFTSTTLTSLVATVGSWGMVCTGVITA